MRYVPILKGKQGELDALRNLSVRARTNVLPLVEVVPSGVSDRDPEAQQLTCDKLVAKLAARWNDAPILIDGVYLDYSLRSSKGSGILKYTVDEARAAGIGAIPVVRLSDSSDAIAEVGRFHQENACGFAVRISDDDLAEDPEELDVALTSLFESSGLTERDADLILDAGPVDSDLGASGIARFMMTLIRGLANIQLWRSVTVAGGAFPLDLTEFTPWTIGVRPRFDADMYLAVTSRRLPVTPDFGDYAVAHPSLQLGPAFSPPPQLRYATAGTWLVLKGRKNDPNGNHQFYDICDAVAAHPDFAGAALGSADARIADPRGNGSGPGNGTIWRQIGTTHHIDLVTQRLASLGEP